MENKAITLTLPLDAMPLILEGLAQLPLFRSKILFELLDAEFKKAMAPAAPPDPKKE